MSTDFATFFPVLTIATWANMPYNQDMIRTVCRDLPKESLGVTLPHEHILIDFRSVQTDTGRSDFLEPLSVNNRYKVYSDPFYLLDNAWYLDEETALKELLLFKESGGKTIVDASLKDIGRNPQALKGLSEKSGVNIVMGCGYYTHGTHPQGFSGYTVKDIAEEIKRELTVGIGGVCAGVIGEIGTSATVTEGEWKAVDAAGIVSIETGFAMHIHTDLWQRTGLDISRRLIKKGVNPAKICINHIDVDIRQDYIEQLLDMGIYVEYDNFGKEFFMPPKDKGWLKGKFAYDYDRCLSIKKLIEKGHGERILITNDICLKSMLTSYGGNGFSHIINNIVPMLCDCGVLNKDIDKLIADNPANFLDV